MSRAYRYKKYTTLLQKHYNDRDTSHGWDHVTQVCNHALYIFDTMGLTNTNDEKIIMISALGHDIWDHKYVGEESEDSIKKEFMKDLSEIGILAYDVDRIIRTIDSISFSTEYKLRQLGQGFDLEKPEELLRNIVSDADKLEALGEVCIKRMIEYEIKSKNNVTIEDHMTHIKRHCNEKLYLLINDGYIHTKIGLELAEPLMREMHDIVDNDRLLYAFIFEYLKTRIE